MLVNTNNTNNGFIKIKLSNKQLSISNSSYGIKNPSRIFERFYKENERGIGIGLHIVAQLCTELNIEKKLSIDNNIVNITLDFSKIIL